MEVDSIGHDEIFVGCGIARAAKLQLMRGDLLKIEQCGDQRALVRRRGLNQGVRFEADQTARSSRAELNHDGHERAGAHMAVDDLVRLAVEAAVYGVSDAVAQSATGMLQEGAGEKAFAIGCHGNFDWIVHSSGHHRFDRSTVDATAKDMGGGCFELLSITQLVVLFRKRAFAPIDPAIAT